MSTEEEKGSTKLREEMNEMNLRDEITSKTNTTQKQSKKSTKVSAAFVPSKSVKTTDTSPEERETIDSTGDSKKDKEKQLKKGEKETDDENKILDINSNQKLSKSNGKQNKLVDVSSEKELLENDAKDTKDGKAIHPSDVIQNKDCEEAASSNVKEGDSDNVTTSNKNPPTNKPPSKPSNKASSKSTDLSNKKTKGRKSNKKARGVQDQEIPDKKQSSLTDHFPVRRSERRIKTLGENEVQLALEKQILSGIEDGLEIKVMEEKGRGIFSAKTFIKDTFVCEYAGELIDFQDAKEREAEYEKDPDIGSYMYFFQYKEKKYCVDATKETSRLGRLVNHSKTSSNVHTKLFPIKNVPRLILVASRDIEIGEELLYDYGDRSKKAAEHHPWLKT